MKYVYFCENFQGNFHAAVAFINEHHPDWDVIAMQFSGNFTQIVYRREEPLIG